MSSSSSENPSPSKGIFVVAEPAAGAVDGAFAAMRKGGGSLLLSTFSGLSRCGRLLLSGPRPNAISSNSSNSCSGKNRTANFLN